MPFHSVLLHSVLSPGADAVLCLQGQLAQSQLVLTSLWDLRALERDVVRHSLQDQLKAAIKSTNLE